MVVINIIETAPTQIWATTTFGSNTILIDAPISTHPGNWLGCHIKGPGIHPATRIIQINHTGLLTVRAILTAPAAGTYHDQYTLINPAQNQTIK